jgi:hypothetical protein
MLCLGIDPDRAPPLAGFTLDQGDDLVERRDLEPAVELLRPLRERLYRPQGLDLGQREVRGEEARLLGAVDDGRALAVCELRVAAPARPLLPPQTKLPRKAPFP